MYPNLILRWFFGQFCDDSEQKKSETRLRTLPQNKNFRSEFLSLFEYKFWSHSNHCEAKHLLCVSQVNFWAFSANFGGYSRTQLLMTLPLRTAWRIERRLFLVFSMNVCCNDLTIVFFPLWRDSTMAFQNKGWTTPCTLSLMFLTLLAEVTP